MITPQKPSLKISQVAESAVRLDKYLATEYPELSRSHLQKLIEQNLVLVNEIEAKASHKLNLGDKVKVNFPPPHQYSLIAEPIHIKIIYEDESLLVVDKPAGLVVYPASGHASHTLINAILAHYPDLVNIDNSLRPGIVHRLDKDTSGLIVIAKNTATQQYLIDQFKARTVTKVYIILIRGKLTPKQGIIEAPVGHDPFNRKRMAIVTEGRQAKTRYQVKEYLGNHTLLEVILETGRTHQIRVHFSAIGYPVIGDAVYGVKSAYVQRQFVHAHRLGFRLPSTGEYQEFACELPPDLTQALEIIRRK